MNNNLSQQYLHSVSLISEKDLYQEFQGVSPGEADGVEAQPSHLQEDHRLLRGYMWSFPSLSPR